MADQGIKKVTILNSSLPTFNNEVNGYAIRYRIISEDKNRTSHWSQQIVLQPNYSYVTGNVSVSKQGSIATVVWDAVEVKIGTNEIRHAVEYDIWVKWGRSGQGDWIYKERISTTSVSMVIPSTYTINGAVQSNPPNELSVEIFLKGVPISREYTALRVYSPPVHTV
jgi:hypothetical protein